jgi:hypothetical protein
MDYQPVYKYVPHNVTEFKTLLNNLFYSNSFYMLEEYFNYNNMWIW